jgi:predicted O-linked N-acetylglucosamine transferase (SPINDLY family)
MSKIGRNDPCHCGSGRKYKHCCVAVGEAAAGVAIPGASSRQGNDRRATAKALSPEDSAALIEAGLAQHQCGQLRAAETLYRRALDLAPDHPDGLHLLGMVAHQTGHHPAALELIDKAILRRPGAADFYNSRGLVARALGRAPAAEDDFRAALGLRPDFAEAHANLGDSLRWCGRLDEAEQSLARALALQPQFADAHHSLGLVFRDQGRLPQALASVRAALALRPDWAQAHSNLGNLYKDSGALEAALASYRTALRLDPTLAGTRVNVGNALRDLGHFEEAIASYREALKADPDLVAAHSGLLLALLYDDPGTPGTHAQATRQFAVSAERHRARAAQSPAADIPSAAGFSDRDRDPRRRLRVGYVSADFRRHSVAHFIEPVLAQHDRAAVEVYAYCNHARHDRVTRRIATLVDHWRDCAEWSDPALEACIRSDRIDILVDLAGHTGHHRLLVFARKPAPVQLSWIGYPASTGLAAIDYFITDAQLCPGAAAQEDYAEQLYRLPRVFSCYRADDAPAMDAPDTAALTAPASVAEDRARAQQAQLGRAAPLVLGSFNHSAKLSRAVVRVWSQLLHRLPEALLFLKSSALSDSAARSVLRSRFAEHGINASRLEMRGHAADPVDHLSAYRAVDIALDTFPYCGVTTTCEALWMGTPVVTLAGERPVARSGVSLLCAVGHPEWIARDEDEYLEKVAALAADPAARERLRRALRVQLQTSPLMDEAGMARDIEHAYREIWQRWCAGGAGA